MEVPLGVILDKDDLQEALDHAAILQNSKSGRAVPDVDALANPVADHHVLVDDTSPTLLADHSLGCFRAGFGEIRHLAWLLGQFRVGFRRSVIIWGATN